MFMSNPIYKKDSNGGIRTWAYTIDGARWQTIAGGPGRKAVTSGWTTCKGKQGRTDVEQAAFEAEAAHEQKLAREYRSHTNELANVPKSPMLAKSYDPATITFPVFSQPKLDGIRATISELGAFSREYQPHLNVAHITAALGPVFKQWPGLWLDGELYNHAFKDDFGKISSIVRKQNPTEEQRTHARAFLKYYIYDIGDDTHTFADREKLMRLIRSTPIWTAESNMAIEWVVTHKVTDAEGLDMLYGQYLEAGYEGQMVRLDLPYEFDKRSKSLLKRKEFITAEFKLLRIEEGSGNWAGYAKRIVFEMPDGRECGAGIRGSQAAMQLLLRLTPLTQERDGVQSSVTIRYFTPTPDGMPRFPVAIDVNLTGRKD